MNHPASNGNIDLVCNTGYYRNVFFISNLFIEFFIYYIKDFLSFCLVRDKRDPISYH